MDSEKSPGSPIFGTKFGTKCCGVNYLLRTRPPPEIKRPRPDEFDWSRVCPMRLFGRSAGYCRWRAITAEPERTVSVSPSCPSTSARYGRIVQALNLLIVFALVVRYVD